MPKKKRDRIRWEQSNMHSIIPHTNIQPTSRRTSIPSPPPLSAFVGGGHMIYQRDDHNANMSEQRIQEVVESIQIFLGNTLAGPRTMMIQLVNA